MKDMINAHTKCYCTFVGTTSNKKITGCGSKTICVNIRPEDLMVFYKDELYQCRNTFALTIDKLLLLNKKGITI
jgi:hypothetical protein